MNIRYIERDGKMILQQQTTCIYLGCGAYHPGGHDWQDIPVHIEIQTQKYEGKLGQILCGIHNLVDPVALTDSAFPEFACSKCHKEPEPQNAILKHVIAGQEANLKWIEKKIAENIITQPETPKKPREFWLDPFYLHGSPFSARALPTGCVGEIYVTEVPKGYKLISRDEAFNAIDAMWIYHRNLNYDEKMKACLKELGFCE